MATRSRPLTAAEALLDQQMSAYWEKALLGLVAAERAREAAAGGADARAPWDAEALPWSALILAALWDERHPLKGRDIDRWIAAIGGRAGTSSMRTTLAQMATTKSPAGTRVLIKDGKLYRLGPDLAAYFAKRWGKFRPAELRWGLVERAVEDRGGADIKAATDQQLANMTRTVESKEVRAEIERRRRDGVWSGAVFVEGAVEATSQAPREFKYPGMRMAHDGTAALVVAAPVETEQQRLARLESARIAAEIAEEDRLDAEYKKIPDRKIIEMHDAGPQIDASGKKIDWNMWDVVLTQISERALFGDLKEHAETLALIRRVKARVGEDILNSDWPGGKPPMPAKLAVVEPVATPDDGVSLYSAAHPDGPNPSDADLSPSSLEPGPEFEDGCPNDPDDPDDIDVIYPTEDELAAIMRGEVVGPAVPEGFEESLDSEDTEG